MGLDPELLKKLLKIFKEELGEQVQVMSDCLLILEKNQISDVEFQTNIQTIFRTAHNIKGASRGLGINDIGDIAHHLESIFSAIDKGKMKVSIPLIDLCLEAVDKMQLVLKAYLEEIPLPFDLANLLTKLANLMNELPEKNKNHEHKTIEPKKKPSPVSMESSTKTESIRVPIENIERISALMEDMQVNKIAIDDHYAELTNLLLKTKKFSNIWKELSYLLRSLGIEKNKTNLEKIYYAGADTFNDVSETVTQLYKNMRVRVNDLNIISATLQDEVRTMRLVPTSILLATLPRYVRDLAHELNKEIDLKMTGDDIRIDKLILDKLRDPLVHLLRNSVDHGIEDKSIRVKSGKNEVGTISIDVREKEGHVYFVISDDGTGMNANEIRKSALAKNLVTAAELGLMKEQDIISLIFRQGFSTKDIITDISGRGVGLDVVKTNVENINGQVMVDTQLGKFTSFTLKVPLTLSSERGLVVSCNNQLFAIPTNGIMHVLTLKVTDIFQIEGRQAIVIDEHPLPFYVLADVFGFEQKKANNKDGLPTIILNNAWNHVAIMVDEIIGERELVIKPLQPPLENLPCVSGGTLYGNNQVIAVLDPNQLIEKSINMLSTHAFDSQPNFETPPVKTHILVVDDSITTRTLEKNILENQNYQVTVAVNGKEAWNILQKQTFALVITDIAMPIMDGFALTEKIKRSPKLKDLPVIIVTSLGSDEEKKRGVDVGADAYIVKHEFESGILLDIVEQLI